MGKKTVYYSDESRDDFANLNIKQRNVDENFAFIHKSFFWNAVSAFLYYIIAIPLAFIVSKVVFGLRIKNRKALKKCKGSAFLYGNHTQYFPDAVDPALISFPARAYVITGAEAISVKGIGWLVQMLGCLPLPTVSSGRNAFRGSVKKLCMGNNKIAIYPEAHIWPYYTGIRNFHAGSFVYPVTNGRPVFAYVTTYRKRLIKSLPPAITVYVSDPFYPDPALEEQQAKEALRGQVYAFMCEAAKLNEVEYYRYINKQPTSGACEEEQEGGSDNK